MDNSLTPRFPNQQRPRLWIVELLRLSSWPRIPPLSPSCSTCPSWLRTRTSPTSTSPASLPWVGPLVCLVLWSRPVSLPTRLVIWWARSGPSRTRLRDSWSKEWYGLKIMDGWRKKGILFISSLSRSESGNDFSVVCIALRLGQTTRLGNPGFE